MPGTAQLEVVRPNPSTVSIKVAPSTQATLTVPGTLFGTFLEPIGESLNGGLLAELLVNGSLEPGLWNHANLEKMFKDQPDLVRSTADTALPLPWLPLDFNAGRRFELHNGEAANSWQSVEIMGTPTADTGILQRVYLPVQRTLAYRVTLYVKHLEGPDKVQLLFREHAGSKVLAQTSVRANQADWTKYSAVLTLPRGSLQPLQPVDFAIKVVGDERIDVDEISLMPGDAIDGLDPDVVAMAKAMHQTQLRFGGNFSSQYHWRQGTGPMDKRPVVENTAWGMPEYNTFGTDEFLAFCRLIDAVPQIDINMGSGTPEEAADWVRYVKAHYAGHVLWELGNELYGKWQTGHIDDKEIAAKTLAFSNAVRSVGSHAEILATGQMPASFTAWNAAQLTNPPGTFEYLTTHFILRPNHVQLQNPSADFLAEAAYALPFELGRRFDAMQAQIDATPAWRGKVHFALDEWLFTGKGGPDRAPNFSNEGGGLLVAGIFNTLFRHAQQVPLADMTGQLDFTGIWKQRSQVYATPSYYVFQLYTTAKGQRILPVTTDSGEYSVRGAVGDYVNMAKIPYIDVVATFSPDKKTLTLFCINRSTATDQPVSIDLGGFTSAATASVEQLAADRLLGNNEEHPTRVVPRPSTIPVTAAGPASTTLPHESWTMITFHSR